MRTYETTFIINPQTDDATLEKHVSDVASIITASKGKILHKNSMGTRRLAYEINGLTQGYYANFLFEAPSDVLPRLDILFTIPLAVILYGLSVYLFLAVADLTYQRRPYYFWIGAILG